MDKKTRQPQNMNYGRCYMHQYNVIHLMAIVASKPIKVLLDQYKIVSKGIKSFIWKIKFKIIHKSSR